MATRARTKAAVTEESSAIVPDLIVQRIGRAEVHIMIEGVTPLIPHKWSQKALRLMQDAQSGVVVEKKRRDPKIPEEEAEASLYRLEDGRAGMPATAFKGAMVGAARLVTGVTMVTLKSGIFVEGEGAEQLVPVDGPLTMRQDTPRNANGVADLRYRYMVWPWSALLKVVYLPSLMSAESVVNLIDAAGNGGVGDWRPSSPKSLTGTFGRFQVAS